MFKNGTMTWSHLNLRTLLHLLTALSTTSQNMLNEPFFPKRINIYQLDKEKS